MAGFRAYPKAKYFDLRDFESPVRGQGFYCLSGTTWQLLKGWLDFYGDWRSRYVVDLEVPINTLQVVDDGGWQTVQDALDLAQHELGDDMSCDLVAAIADVAAAIRNQQSCCGASAGNIPTPPGTITGNEETPPDGYIVPTAPNTYRCDAANVYWQGVSDVLNELIAVGFESQITLGVAVIGLVLQTVVLSTSTFLASFVEYVGWIANIINGLFQGTFDLETCETAWDTNKADIICTLAGSATTSERKLAYDALIDDWGLSDANAAFLKAFADLSVMAAMVYTPESLAGSFADLVNGIDSTYYDCSQCVQDCLEFYVLPVELGGGGTVVDNENGTITMTGVLAPDGKYRVGVKFNFLSDGSNCCGEQKEVSYASGSSVLEAGLGFRYWSDTEGDCLSLTLDYSNANVFSGTQTMRQLILRSNGPFTTVFNHADVV